MALVCSITSGFGGAFLVAVINQALAQPSDAERLAGRFALASVLVLVLRYVSQAQFAHLAQHTLARLRTRIAEQFLRAPLRTLENLGSGRVMAVLTEDVGTISDFLVAIPTLAMHAAVVVGCLVYLGTLSWHVLLFALFMVLLGSLGYHWAHSKALSTLRRARSREDELFHQFAAIFSGAKELRLSSTRRRAFLSSLLLPNIEEVRALSTRGTAIYVAAASWGSFLFFVLIGTVVFVASRAFAIEPAVMSGYALMFLYMMLPLEALLNALPQLNRARVAVERVQRVVAETSAASSVEGSSAPPPFSCLRMKSVTYNYEGSPDDSSFELGPLDMDLKAGELVFLAGGNGAGKTTLMKLLVGLYAPSSGEIAVNGQAVQAEQRETYRNHFSAIFSDFHLFERLLGIDANELDERIHELLVSLELETKVRVVNGAFSTTELSQGQRKRLALLVCCLENRPVCVFDEWAADQDPLYKEVFYRRVLPELKRSGRAVLVITHDDRYFDVADRLLVLESGKVMERRRATVFSAQRADLAVG